MNTGFSAYDILDQFRLNDTVSIVTGASRGLGKSMAESLAGAGSNVVLVGRYLDTLNQVAESIKLSTGRRAIAIQADVSISQQRDSVIKRTIEEFGAIDILVNNAAIDSRGNAFDYPIKDWEKIIGVNLTGAFYMAQACGKKMRHRNRGKIINILSLTSSWGLPTVIPYTAAKGGLMQLTKVLAVEWAEHNILVNAIAPGFFRTAMTKRAQKDVRNKWVLSRCPLKRWGEPTEICGALLYLASPASSYVTGSILWVDGGITAGSNWLIS